jgi:hypothetical protein
MAACPASWTAVRNRSSQAVNAPLPSRCVARFSSSRMSTTHRVYPTLRRKPPAHGMVFAERPSSRWFRIGPADLRGWVAVGNHPPPPLRFSARYEVPRRPAISRTTPSQSPLRLTRENVAALESTLLLTATPNDIVAAQGRHDAGKATAADRELLGVWAKTGSPPLRVASPARIRRWLTQLAKRSRPVRTRTRARGRAVRRRVRTASRGSPSRRSSADDGEHDLAPSSGRAT